MARSIVIFLVTSFIVLIINQSFYGSCFSSYCMAAAFPKVILISLAISAFIVWSSRNEQKNNGKDSNDV